MKKKLFIATIATVAGGVAWNMQQKSCQNTTLSDLALENVEALAQEVIDGGPYYACWETLSATTGASLLYEKTYCINCSVVPATSWSNNNGCRK